jgi:hypothetical protein
VKCPAEVCIRATDPFCGAKLTCGWQEGHEGYHACTLPGGELFLDDTEPRVITWGVRRKL